MNDGRIQISLSMPVKQMNQVKKPLDAPNTNGTRKMEISISTTISEGFAHKFAAKYHASSILQNQVKNCRFAVMGMDENDDSSKKTSEEKTHRHRRMYRIVAHTVGIVHYDFEGLQPQLRLVRYKYINAVFGRSGSSEDILANARELNADVFCFPNCYSEKYPIQNLPTYRNG
jgi:hypothetical protein